MMGSLLAAVVALLVSAASALLLPRAGALGGRLGGLALPVGLAAGLVTLWASGSATNLALLLPAATLVACVVEALGAALGLHRCWRLAGSSLVLGAAMVAEWRRGDLFASGAVLAAAASVAAFAVIVFATSAAQRSGAPRTPSALGLLGAVWLLVVAAGLPTPGLASLSVVAIAAIVPLVLWPPRAWDEVVLGPALGAVAVALGVYAWIANASPAMVWAPVAVVGLDVIWTLTRRLVTVSGRARLSSAGGWWRGVDAWGEPADDLVAQRVVSRTSGVTASGWLLGATVAVVVVAWVTWRLAVPWVPAALAMGILAAGWLLLQHALLGLSRAETIAWLCGLSAVGLGSAFLTRVEDARVVAVAVPLIALAAVWAGLAGVWSRAPGADGVRVGPRLP
jgi:hypothetical protein